jgi:hypothetical protein
MSVQPSDPVGLTRLDIAVDIQPLSRHDEDLPDVATMVSTLVIGNGKVLQLVEQQPVFENEDGMRQLTVAVPPAWTDLAKGAQFHVTVLLPRATERWEVSEVSATVELDEMATVDMDQTTLAGGRECVVVFGDKDELDLVWKYIRN